VPGPNIWIFDPSVFIDDDAQAYLYFGGNGESNGRVIRLNSDMISVNGSASSISAPNYFEAPFVFKRNGLFYYTYSTNTNGGLRIDYQTSSNPISGWSYRGIVAGQPPSNNNNNHASEFLLNGQWYHVYHNRFQAMQTGTPPVYKRNIAIERMNFNTDNTIQQVAYTTDGVPQAGNLNRRRKPAAKGA
jgi:arabinoxylan arabinofuranohydrolase